MTPPGRHHGTGCSMLGCRNHHCDTGLISGTWKYLGTITIIPLSPRLSLPLVEDDDEHSHACALIGRKHDGSLAPPNEILARRRYDVRIYSQDTTTGVAASVQQLVPVESADGKLDGGDHSSRYSSCIPAFDHYRRATTSITCRCRTWRV